MILKIKLFAMKKSTFIILSLALIFMNCGGDNSKKNELKKQAEKIKPQAADFQLSFIQLDDPLLIQIKEDILNTDINTLTPVEALMKLNEIKSILNK